jgi:hypothetical protein
MWRGIFGPNDLGRIQGAVKIGQTDSNAQAGRIGAVYSEGAVKHRLWVELKPQVEREPTTLAVNSDARDNDGK